MTSSILELEEQVNGGSGGRYSWVEPFNLERASGVNVGRESDNRVKPCNLECASPGLDGDTQLDGVCRALGVC